MSKSKWALLVLGILDLLFILSYSNGIVLLLLQSTGYIVPIIINILVVSVIIYQSKYSRLWIVIVIILSIPIILFQFFFVMPLGTRYATIDSPHNRQSIVVEYRHATLGETTYFYTFYKTKWSIVGKRLNDQSIEIMTRDYSNGIDAKATLGIGQEEWVTDRIVQFDTLEGRKQIYLDPLAIADYIQELVEDAAEGGLAGADELEEDNTEKLDENSEDYPEVSDEAIQNFITKSEHNEDGETLSINGNKLTVRYDEPTGQEWIDVTGEGEIPWQQCTRIIQDLEQGYYMLEECTHRWEYRLYPLQRIDEGQEITPEKE